MAGINYEEYVKGLGDVPTNQELVIKKYLDELSEKDESFKAAYNPDINVIHDCYNFIKEAVSKLQHTGNFICVEDAVVFKMARDYFIDILPTLDKPEEKKEEPVKDNVKRTELGFEVFGEEADEPEETAEEPCDQEEVEEEEPEEELVPVEAVKSDMPKYDEDGNGLFEFM